MKPLLIRAATVTTASLLLLLWISAEAQDHRGYTPEPPAVQDGSASIPAARDSQTSNTSERRELSVMEGRSALVDSALPIERVAVGLGDFAVATAVTPYEILLNGKAPGLTSLIVWQQGGGKLFFDVTVEPSRFDGAMRLKRVERQIELELPGRDIHLTQEGDVVFLRGTVEDMTSADRALSIASILGKAVNLLYVDVPASEPQILLRVKFASVDRNISTVLGINLFSTGATNTTGAITTQQFSPPAFSSVGGGAAAPVTLSDALNLFLFRPDLNLGATIKALETKGLLEVLSEPNVLAQNGQQASFLAGGEFPFPVVQGGSGGTPSISIQFREFGVRLNFLPTITPRGSIVLRVAPEVSALDFTHGLTVSGFLVPALTVRKLNTTVELNPGQSFAIGGLLDNRVTETLEKIPFLGSIPVLGRFFQSRLRNKENTELMVIVTPEIVQPVQQGKPIRDLKFPSPFLPSNSSPDFGTFGSGSSPETPAGPMPAMQVEKLMKSLHLESPSSQAAPMPMLQLQPAGGAPSTGSAKQ
ncbi:MAG: pilus assembly protein N-terminal domain-containing protein [Bryobacteraceae bacterium]